MLRVRFFAILNLVLINVLVINCLPVHPSAADYHLENYSLKDGALYNPNSTERGPISAEIFDDHQMLSFLGSFNGRSWYIQRTLSTYQDAISGCNNLGMTLARTNQAELTFLSTVTSASDTHSWLGGSFRLTLGAFVWLDNSVASGLTLNGIDTVGLTWCRFDPPSASQVHSTTETTRQFYICTF